MTPDIESAIGNSAGQVAANAVTADQLFEMPRDGMRRELVRGELRLMSPTEFEHGKIVVRITSPLDRHVEENGLGVVVGAETGYFIARDPDTVRAPDVSFVSQRRIEEVGVTKKFFPAAPDLAVEVLSPNDTVFDVDEKVEEWLASGVRLVWVVNPKRRTVAVYHSLMDVKILSENDDLEGEDVVPGFRHRIADIFT
ncbi:MAG: Uma2 family endonuclease [Blastocatellia bacterium]